MTRLTVAAAALVAGMTAFAVNAQEAPGRAAAIADAVAVTSDEAGATIIARMGRGSAVAVPVAAETALPSKAEPKTKPGKVATKVTGKAAKARKALPTSEEYEQGMIFTPEAAGEAAAKPVLNSQPTAQYEQGMAFAADIDKTQTGSTAKRKRPELVAVARKAVKGDAEAIVAEAKAGGKVSGGNYGALISRYAATYGVPVALAHAVIRVESNYRPNARGKAGEIGLMQIKPATARAMGYSGGAAGLYNPETNIRFGMKYLAMAHQLGGGSTCGTILKYNAGHGARRMNPVSAAYCRKVKRHLGA